MDRELQSLVNSIEESDYEDYPYEHLYGTNLFSEEFYGEMLDNLPPDEKYWDFNHADAMIDASKSSRLMIEVDQLLDNPLWSRVFDIFNSDEFKKSLLNKFNKTVRTEACSPTAFLTRDKKQYKISPHPDVSNKIITFQMYMPHDNSHEKLGTNILKCFGPHRYEQHKRFAFHRNSCYAFPVTKTSYHSCDVSPYEGDFDRNTIQCIFYDNEKLFF